MSKRKPFDPMGTKYDMKTALEAGDKPVLNPEDNKMHWHSLDPRTGMVLKGRRGSMKSWAAHEITESALGAKQEFKKGRYYSVPDPKLQLNEKTLTPKKQEYMDGITQKGKKS